ncbi:MAG: DMT family transporter [Actinobacteria bacterium]|nr:DMT family transporter [Actinomycetota bacterium]
MAAALALALASATVFGAADFLGGLASRRTATLTVVLVSQLWGLSLLVASLPWLPGHATAADMAWGAASGLVAGVGLAVFYRSLATGTMSVVAPITAVSAAALPVMVGLALGERPPPAALVGIAVALTAVVLISRDDGGAAEPLGRPTAPVGRMVIEAVGAGVAFGLFFILLDRTGPDSGLWPLLAARFASIGLFTAAAFVTRRSPRPALSAMPVVAGAGLCDMVANVLYLLAVRGGLLSIVAALTSLYPASTVLLARWWLGERLGRAQAVGLGCAALAVMLIMAP